MKPKFILLSIMSFFVLSANAQTIQTYKGQLKSPKNIPLAGDELFDANYRYYLGENKRIWHGAFTIKSVSQEISGSFVNGKKSGKWTWERNGSNYNRTYGDAIITATFKDNELNGKFKIVTNGEVMEGKFLDNHLADTLYIDYRERRYVTATKPAKYVYTVIKSARLLFDENGFANGDWAYLTRQGIKQQTEYFFKNGLLLGAGVYDDSTGETTVSYKLDPNVYRLIIYCQSKGWLTMNYTNRVPKYKDANNTLQNNTDTSQLGDQEYLSFLNEYDFKCNYNDFFDFYPISELHDLLNESCAMNGKDENSWLPFVHLSMNIEGIALHSKAIEETIKTVAVCDTIRERLYLLEQNLESSNTQQSKNKKGKKATRVALLGLLGALAGGGEGAAMGTSIGKGINDGIVSEQYAKKKIILESAIEWMKTTRSRDELNGLMETLNGEDISNIANIDSIYASLPPYEAKQVNNIREDGNGVYTFDFISNYGICELSYNASEDIVVKRGSSFKNQ